MLACVDVDYRDDAARLLAFWYWSHSNRGPFRYTARIDTPILKEQLINGFPEKGLCPADNGGHDAAGFVICLPYV